MQKILAASGVASRRHSETLILEGRVTVNGAIIRELGTRADPVSDDIRVDGRRIRPAPRRIYLLVNKPRGYVTTRSDPQGRPTVLDLVSGLREYVYPVGRLDYDSEGLLLLTNDGELAARLTHPRTGIERVYWARVRGTPDRHVLERLANGLVLDGRRTRRARVRLLQIGRGLHRDQSLLEITLREGRNRQVRRMCEAIGHQVVRLRRVGIGPIADDSLKPGEVRPLRPGEVRALKALLVNGQQLILRP